MSIAAPLHTAYAPESRPQTSRLRITARGRKVLAVVIALPVITVLGLLAMFSGGSAIATGSTGAADFDYLTVQAGQSLWGIAETIAPDADPRDVIAEIMSLNQLHESSVQPGQRIAVPADLAD
ncbi:LysM peptidoglycan-binding domain-containing protein [Herbiconiux ginsengi]|uniref:LysM domain-containing protein n=1 Tax=Herbiconiux ginsengi TaxID=381665 RepID=A0A1H3T2H3_9MICO|nr:LysM peptidoglycan-binding domain-containing protein [Herbiconiux ginsengi]SDZ44384.1 LysM domain-containing protein [Herbiconiux ginsengi]